jgi:hypothetical protein
MTSANPVVVEYSTLCAEHGRQCDRIARVEQDVAQGSKRLDRTEQQIDDIRITLASWKGMVVGAIFISSAVATAITLVIQFFVR